MCVRVRDPLVLTGSALLLQVYCTLPQPSEWSVNNPGWLWLLFPHICARNSWNSWSPDRWSSLLSFLAHFELPRHAEKSSPPFKVALIDASRAVFIGHQSQPATSPLLPLIFSLARSFSCTLFFLMYLFISNALLFRYDNTACEIHTAVKSWIPATAPEGWGKATLNSWTFLLTSFHPS